MIHEQILLKLISELKAEKDNLAHGSMDVTESNPFAHGVMVGMYRGLAVAQQILDELINEADH